MEKGGKHGGAGGLQDHLTPASVHEWHTPSLPQPAVRSQHPVREYTRANMRQMKRGAACLLLTLLSLSTVQATRKYEMSGIVDILRFPHAMTLHSRHVLHSNLSLHIGN